MNKKKERMKEIKKERKKERNKEIKKKRKKERKKETALEPGRAINERKP
jgi:hypothetical protein